MKITKAVRSMLADVLDCKNVTPSFETLEICAALALVSPFAPGAGTLASFGGTKYHPREVPLTPAGRAIGLAELERLAKVRARKNASTRGRNEAMRSIGLTKTPYGWE